ncbi:MAG TPA: helix-turn-helix domain-containing protein [Pyrinomonadaceae bacterium]|mgnify:CR=1 FL=1|nr:helix-turn-helix domain-containing protein [Pyrinomonadaceae bacterium]
MKLLSTREAAQELGISPIRVRQLIQEGKLKASRVGRDYVIEEKDLAAVQTYGKPGRPKKSAQ